MDTLPHKTNVNSFGYFLKTVENSEPDKAPVTTPTTAAGNVGDCAPGECNDPQLKILQALTDCGGPSCALDLMKSTKLPPTVLLETLRTMKEFGLIKLLETGAQGSEDRPPEVELTPCGQRALELYK